MNNKILISLCVIAAVAAIAVGGTIAYFSDVETSVGNTFTAGNLDLKVDSECHYNGNVCALGDWDNDPLTSDTYSWQGSASYPVPGTACACTWLEKDLTANDIFFNYDDVKPGDFGENTISLTAKDNDAFLCGYVKDLVKNDNNCNEPETTAGDVTCGPIGGGELQDYILMTIWEDADCNNILDPGTRGQCTGEGCTEWPVETCGQHEGCTWVPGTLGETVLVSGVPIDSNNNVWQLGQLIGDQKTCLGVGWNVPGPTGNIIQSDSVTGDIGFYVEQVRNNSSFVCPALADLPPVIP